METNKIIAQLKEDCRSCALTSLCHDGRTHVYCPVRDAVGRLEELVDRCARYAEEIAVLRERRRWIPAAERLPETDDFVLGIVNGKPEENITLVNEVQIVNYCENDVGWWLPEYPFWDHAEVPYWMPLPDAPEEVGSYA